MRISDYRYARDRKTLEIAARLIEFEARTGTIRELTGLSDTRIRSLSKECGDEGRPGGKIRHRGSSPYKVKYLLDREISRNEAAALLSMCRLMGVAAKQYAIEQGGPASRLRRAEQLCDTFWTFRYLFPKTAIGFEHMLLLIDETAKGEEATILSCGNCRALHLVDPLTIYPRHCSHCADLPHGHHIHPEFSSLRRIAEENAAYRYPPLASSADSVGK